MAAGAEFTRQQKKGRERQQNSTRPYLEQAGQGLRPMYIFGSKRQSSSSSVARWRLFLVLCLSISTCFGYADDVSNEYRVKAAMIYKLAKFVFWPEDDQAQLRVCALGRDVFGSALGALEGKQVRGASLAVDRPEDMEIAAESCDVIFIADDMMDELDAILRPLGGRPVLTIGDGSSFAQRGGIIELANQNNRIKIIINQTSAKLSGLKISAPLLDLATVIE